jgi:hypothetical protein
MFKLPNPYIMAAGAVALVSVAGTFEFQSRQIHHFHSMYDKSLTVIALRDQQIKDMTAAQNTQTSKSEQAVIKVIQGPKEVQSIIREIRSAPVSGPCIPPKYSEDITNAF